MFSALVPDTDSAFNAITSTTTVLWQQQVCPPWDHAYPVLEDAVVVSDVVADCALFADQRHLRMKTMHSQAERGWVML